MNPILVYGERKEERRIERVIEKESKLIAKEKGGVVVIGEVEIEIPAGALKKDTEISVSKLRITNELEAGIENVTEGARGYRFEPKGTKFKKDVIIRMGYDKKLNADEVALSNLYTYWYNERKRSWEALERVEIDREECKVVSKTNHFTDMINATLQDIEGVAEASVNINSIKGLEAADPNSGVGNIEGLEGNNQGNANLSIGIDLPGGRRGMKPRLSIGYSSGGGSDECGKGFGIQGLSSITIDTRWGLPKYDGEDQYLLDGEKIEKIAREGKDKNGNEIQYYETKVKKNYEEIKRIKREDGSYYWEVRSKDGRKRIYGFNKIEKYSQEESEEEGDVIEEKVQKIEEKVQKYEYKLDREEDARGNNVVYSYGIQDNYIWLKEIAYTGKGKEEGKYKVKLETEEKEEDIRIDGRGKFLREQNLVYSKIGVYYEEEEIWNYRLEYGKVGFGKKVLKSISKGIGEEEFWKYKFEYMEEDKVEAEDGNSVIGYNGFKSITEVGIENLGGEDGEGIQKSTSEGTGKNSSFTVSFNLFKIFSASVGVNGGFTSSEGKTEYGLREINGDGKVEIVKKEDIKDSNNRVLLESLETNGQYGTSIGASGGLDAAGIVGANASYTQQNTRSYSRGMFVDIDGDGYVDYLEEGKNKYLKNEAGKFKEVGLRIDCTEDEKIEVADYEENKEKYKIEYYVEEPFREWIAPRSGKVRVRYGSRTEKEAVETNVYKGNEKIEDLEEIEIKKGEGLYFVLQEKEEGDIEISEEVEWKIEIEYTEVEIFERIGKGSVLLVEDAKDGKGIVWSDARDLIREGKIGLPKEITKAVAEELAETEEGKETVWVNYEGGEEDEEDSNEKSITKWELVKNHYKYDVNQEVYIQKEDNKVNVEFEIIDDITVEEIYRELIKEISEESQKKIIGINWGKEWVYPYKQGEERIVERRVEEEYANKLDSLEQENVNAEGKEYTKSGVEYRESYENVYEVIEEIGKEVYEKYFKEKLSEEYYSLTENGNYRITEEADREKIKEITQEIGIKVYGKKITECKYKSGARVAVENGKVSYEVLENGKLVEKEEEVRSYNSEEDFSTEDLTIEESSTGEKESKELFLVNKGRGGKNNWYYGIWNGYYDWDY